MDPPPPPPPSASSEPPPVAAASPSQAAQPPSPAPSPAQPPPSSTPSTPAETLTPPTSSSSSSAPSPTQNPSTPPQPLSQPQPSPQQQSQTQPPSIQPQQRPPLNRSRPQTPYAHFAHHLPSAPTSSSGPPSSIASPSPSPAPMQRGGLAIGVPAHNPHHPRPQQPPLSFSTFSPSPPFSQPFSSTPRVPEQSPTSSSQVRQPVQGIQNIGMIGALSAGSQIRPSVMSGSQQQRFGQPPLRSASPSANQTLNSQKFPSHGLPRTPSMASPSSPSPVSQSQSLQQQLSSAQGKQMHAPSAPSSSYRPSVKPHVLQQRPHHLQQHQHSLPMTSHQQQIPSSQQQQQQKQQQQLQLQQHQQQASLSHQSHEHHNQQYVALRNQQSVTQQQQAVRALGSTVQKSNVPGQGQSGVVQSGNISPVVNADDAESGNHVLSKRSLRELVAQIDPFEKLDSEVEDVLVEVAEDFIESVTTFACSLAKHRKSTTLEAKDILLHVERNWNMTLPGFGGDEIKCYKKQIKKSMVATSDAGNPKNPAAGQAASNAKAHAAKAPAIGSPKTH
ncbi:transcription initiation factor TFIID subunit 12 isoform X2 [Phoenix dactylifera]|uniref:Transcription initiation factor TFIID subunit 12 isoform X2 n=1 Tax=Phoenix dactylifera TaxID=42345 RepID=A0A8B7MWU0_PHODC|nr:transcription initiation factor TFIID subunit 12 isoform X2 [Phoenix dactylifera]